jgi:hypothetical protein
LLHGRQLEALDLQIENLPVLVRDFRDLLGGLQGVRGSSSSWTSLPSPLQNGTLTLLGLEDMERTADSIIAKARSPRRNRQI